MAAIHVRCWQVAYRGLLPDAYLDGLRTEDRMVRYTLGSTDPGAPATILAVDGKIWGFATTGPSRDREPVAGEIYALYVDPRNWGLGAGRLLVAEARAALSRRGFAEATLWVLVGNERAQHFYCADGWLPDQSRRTEAVWGVKVDVIRYRRALP